jgi:hypothetical protein
LPRDLGDVLHYFLPTAAAGGPARDAGPVGAAWSPVEGPARPAALPVVAIPVGEHDVVRAAFVWNLAVEIARFGASATLVAPEEVEASPLWPEPGPGPLGAELVVAPARSLGDLYKAALDAAVGRAADSAEGGLVLVRVPPVWLRDASDGQALLRWVLLFSSSESRDLLETYAVARRVWALRAEARVGVTIHGARRTADAERAFQRLSDAVRRHAGGSLLSYGLLVDDLHVYRAIVSRRPIGLEHPQSRAARALGDVARLLLEDARMSAVA